MRRANPVNCLAGKNKEWRWAAPPGLIDSLGDLPLTPQAAYAVSFLVCWAMSVRSGQDFDFDRIARVTGDFDPATDDAADRPVAQPAGARAS